MRVYANRNDDGTEFVRLPGSQRPVRAAYMTAHFHREQQIDEITTKLLEARPDSLRSKLRNIRSFVVTRMQDLRAVLNSDVGHVRAELAKHIDQITLTPTGDAYVASGTWNFVGRGSIGGAGGPVCTTRATDFSFSLAA